MNTRGQEHEMVQIRLFTAAPFFKKLGNIFFLLEGVNKIKYVQYMLSRAFRFAVIVG